MRNQTLLAGFAILFVSQSAFAAKKVACDVLDEGQKIFSVSLTDTSAKTGTFSIRLEAFSNDGGPQGSYEQCNSLPPSPTGELYFMCNDQDGPMAFYYNSRTKTGRLQIPGPADLRCKDISI